MRILTRYVLAELTKVFLVSLAGLTLMMLLVGVVREAASQNLPPAQIVRLLPYILPDALRFAVPVTLLLATCVVFGRMSGSNEVVATKALGISPVVLLVPALVVAFLLSLVSVWLNDLAVSWGRSGAQRVVVEAVEEIAYNMLRAQRSYSSPTFSINVKQLQGRRLILPTLTLQGRDGAPGITITASEAELKADQVAGVLRIILHKGTFEVDGKVSFEFPDVFEQEIQLREASRAKDVGGLPSWLSLKIIPEQVAKQRQAIDAIKQKFAVQAGYQMLCADFEGLTGPEWQTRDRILANAQGQLHRLLTEPHRRWSAGFSCLCFAWVGAPMAIRLRNRDFLTSFFLCFLPILIVYYPLLAYGADGAKNGSIPPCAVWAGNVLLLGWGAWLLQKVVRY